MHAKYLRLHLSCYLEELLLESWGGAFHSERIAGKLMLLLANLPFQQHDVLTCDNETTMSLGYLQ